MTEQKKKKFQYFFEKYALFYGALFLVAASFTAGYQFHSLNNDSRLSQTQGGKVTNTQSPLPSYLEKNIDFSLFWEVWKRVKSDYFVKNIPDTQLLYGSLQGIVDALDDPYSSFLSPETAKKFDESLEGAFEGIGAEIGIKEGQLKVITPLSGTPAAKAGLRAGDSILSIDAKNTVNMSVDSAVSLIRGKGGTKVVLVVFRAGEKKERTITIVRSKIIVPSVTWKLVPDHQAVALIKISQFNQETDTAFKTIVREMLGKKVKSIVLDLRNNPGGFLETAVQVTGYWIDGKVVVRERYDEGQQEEFSSTVLPIFKEMPTVVLVNEGSASAAEIMAGALQDYGIAKIVGKKTFGKGSVQNLQRLKDGSALKLTVAQWLTPNGRFIHEKGIEPDVEVELTDDDFTAGKDPQLSRALEILEKK